MHAIESLISGFPAAANGHAELYVRGTSTRATYYTDFEGEQAVSGTNIDLNANGSAVVYVNQLVTVVVKDADGATVAEFVSGIAAASVEARSLSFTGTDYESGQVAAGNPTNLASILDLWIASAGATNFQADGGDGPRNLTELFGAFSGFLFNVKSYGAVGDGATDDLAAIQAAIDAAHAVTVTGSSIGAVVYFPAGTYRTTNKIVSKAVTLLGAGPLASKITIDHASNDCLDWQDYVPAANIRVPRLMMGLTLTQSQASSGVLSRYDGSDSDAVYHSNCVFATHASSTGPVLRSSTAGGRDLRFSQCLFLPTNTCALLSVTTDTSRWTFVSNRIRTVAAYAPSAGMFNAGVLVLANNWIDNTPSTSGTWNVIRVSTSTPVFLNLTGNYISGPGGAATITAISIADPVGGGNTIYEVGNTIATNVLYEMTFDGTESNIHLGAREKRRFASVEPASPLALDLLNYGIFEIERTSNTALVTEFAAATGGVLPEGAEVLVLYESTDAADTTAVLTLGDTVTGDMVSRGVTTYAPPSSVTDTAHFVRGTVFHIAGESTNTIVWEPIAEDQGF